MYRFSFVRIINGKSKTESFHSVHAAHTAMGIYAGKHDLNINVHEDRWRENAKSIMYKGTDFTFGTVGYVTQEGPSTPQPKPQGKTRIKKRKTNDG